VRLGQLEQLEHKDFKDFKVLLGQQERLGRQEQPALQEQLEPLEHKAQLVQPT